MPEDQPNPPPRQKNQKIVSAGWMKVTGAVFAATLVLAFLGLGILSAVDPNVEFNCSTFSFLAGAFAIGAAMTGVFLGGGAAIGGDLGPHAQQYPLRFSLVGGVAVMAVMLVLFYLILRPTACSEKTEVSLSLERIPLSMNAFPAHKFWTRSSSSDRDYRTFEVLIPNRQDSGWVRVSERLEEVCNLNVRFNVGSESIGESVVTLKIPDVASIPLEFVLPLRRTELNETNDCFRYEGRIISGQIVIDLARRNVHMPQPAIANKPDLNELAGYGGLHRDLEYSEENLEFGIWHALFVAYAQPNDDILALRTYVFHPG